MSFLKYIAVAMQRPRLQYYIAVPKTRKWGPEAVLVLRKATVLLTKYKKQAYKK